MPQKNKIKYSPAAVDDMDEIFSYITQDNFFAAENMLEKLNHSISSLADFPNIGSVLSDDEYSLIQRGYRFIVVNPYLVFYRIMYDTVIHRILHGRRTIFVSCLVRLNNKSSRSNVSGFFCT